MSTGVMTVHWGGPLNITVTLHSDEQGSEELKKREGLNCRTLAEFEPSPEIQQIFQELQYGAQGKDLADDWYWELSELPALFQSFIWDVQEQLLQPADKVIRLLRWRFDLTGSREVSSQQTFEWSLDGNSWWPVPYDLIARLDRYAEAINPSPVLGEASTDGKLSDLLAAGLDEPAGHAILREAWSLWNRSPSTSLILGMTAVEIGVKQCVAILSPRYCLASAGGPDPCRREDA
jgi:hypothetical protein